MKTIEEINKKIQKGDAVVLTASEAKELAEKESVNEVARKVDVVTTATFSPMCSSGVFLNLGHARPAMKMQKVLLDGVPAYGGIASVDVFLGATQESESNPKFGGAHVIQKLVKGESVEIEAKGTPTHCYPGGYRKGKFTLNQINQAYFFNPRNCYQNYNAATNSSKEPMNTYMGKLLPEFRSVHYSGAGEISPLFNDPELRTIGIGTRIFYCGGTGYIAWEGTQFNGNQEKDKDTELPVGPAATLAVVADLRGVLPEFVKPVVIPGYGVSLYVAVGIPIPVLDEDMAAKIAIRNKHIKTKIVDYATDQMVDMVNYDDLFHNNVLINGKKTRTKTMSNLSVAMKITSILKDWIQAGTFTLTQPVRTLPVHGHVKGFPE